jgi:hypothetical protein
MANRNVNDIYNIIVYITRKERGAFITPEEAMRIVDLGQMELLLDAYKSYETTQTYIDALSPFNVRLQFTSDGAGQVTIPSDYQQFLGAVFTVTGSTVNPVRFVATDSLPDALTSQLRPVTTSNPRALNTANGFQLFPNRVQTGFYSYIRRPAYPVLAYTLVNRTLTYDPVNSVQVEFYDIYINDIIARALKYLGINLDEQQVEEFARYNEKETNL